MGTLPTLVSGSWTRAVEYNIVVIIYTMNPGAFNTKYKVHNIIMQLLHEAVGVKP